MRSIGELWHCHSGMWEQKMPHDCCYFCQLLISLISLNFCNWFPFFLLHWRLFRENFQYHPSSDFKVIVCFDTLVWRLIMLVASCRTNEWMFGWMKNKRTKRLNKWRNVLPHVHCLRHFCVNYISGNKFAYLWHFLIKLLSFVTAKCPSNHLQPAMQQQHRYCHHHQQHQMCCPFHHHRALVSHAAARAILHFELYSKYQL